MLLLSTATFGAAQSGIPGGGYTQTCQDIRTHGDTLEARCQTRDGGWNRTSLRDYDRCNSSIENDNGNLVCNKGDRRDDRDRDRREGDRDRDRGEGPRGGYRQTCRDIRTDDGNLYATCEKKNGKWKHTSLRDFRGCASEIENKNGKLVCNR